MANVDEEKGLKLLQSAAELGHPAAHYHLAWPTGAVLHREARRLSSLTSRRRPRAAAAMRSSCRPGDGVAKDETRGVRLLEEGSQTGHADATVSLGATWYVGQDRPPSRKS